MHCHKIVVNMSEDKISSPMVGYHIEIYFYVIDFLSSGQETALSFSVWDVMTLRSHTIAGTDLNCEQHTEMIFHQ